MNKKVALLVLLFAVTAIVCRSEDDKEKDASWTDWAKDKISGAFHHDHAKETKDAALNTANTAKDGASGSADDMGEKAGEAEDAAADAAKQLSDKPSD